MVASRCEASQNVLGHRLTDDQHDIKHWRHALTTSDDTSTAYDTRTQLEYKLYDANTPAAIHCCTIGFTVIALLLLRLTM